MKRFIALSLLVSSGMFADQPKNNHVPPPPPATTSSCCPTDCCKPCCVPQPKKCIDCECYTPHFYDLQCDWGVFLDIEFLYWYARESDLAYAIKVEGVNQNPANPAAQRLVSAPKKLKHFKTEWDPGFRIGLGWNSECDGWDIYANWTYYHNKKRESTSVSDFGVLGNLFFPGLGQDALVAPWVNQAVSISNLNNIRILFNDVTAKWRFNLNYIDLELGRKYWLSRCFTMRPFVALRGGWTKLSFRTTAQRFSDALPNLTVIFRDRFTNRYWGVGFLVGIQPEWHFSPNFTLFSNLDAALLWGNARVRKHENYFSTTAGGNSEINYHNHLNSRFAKMQAILDVAIGLRWQQTWCCDRYRTSLDAGWEHHIWFDTNNRMKFTNITLNSFGGGNFQYGFSNCDEAYGNLSFGGLVVRFRLDF